MSISNLRYKVKPVANRIKQTACKEAVTVDNADKVATKADNVKETRKPLLIEVEPLVLEIGNTIYRVNAFSSPNAKLDLIEKMRQMILNDNSPE